MEAEPELIEQQQQPEPDDRTRVAIMLDDHFLSLARGESGDQVFAELLRLTRFDSTPEIGRCRTVLKLMQEASRRDELYQELQDIQNQPDDSGQLIQQAREDAKRFEAEFEQAIAAFGDDELEGAEGGSEYAARAELAASPRRALAANLKQCRRRELDAQQKRVDREATIDDLTIALGRANQAFERLSEIALLPLHLRFDRDAQEKTSFNKQRNELDQFVRQGEAVLSFLDPSRKFSNDNKPSCFLIDQLANEVGSKITTDDLWDTPQQYSGESAWTAKNHHLFGELSDQIKVAIIEAKAELRTINRQLSKLAENRDLSYYQSRV